MFIISYLYSFVKGVMKIFFKKNRTVILYCPINYLIFQNILFLKLILSRAIPTATYKAVLTAI